MVCMRLLIYVVVIDAMACAGGTPNAKPHDMSTAGHEAAAQREEHTAKLHAAQYDRNAAVSSEHCARQPP